jgi:hypothetical protein
MRYELTCFLRWSRNMQQPFECQCGSERCLGTVRGAQYLDEAVLRKYWLNPHIERLLLQKKEASFGRG